VQSDPSAPPAYQVDLEDAPRLFIPITIQLEPVAYLHLAAKNPDRMLPIALGSKPRRAEMVRKRIKNAVRAIERAAPVLADALSRVEVRTWDGQVYIRLPWHAGAPAIGT
jgi:hypothetical protein